ncbi:MAG: hypothetical protein KF708_13400 [Pirellulales bacterium]|nr:hypothetical protein [Pirellulales bacterium]
MWNPWSSACVTLLSAALSLALLVGRRPSLRGTTLVAPWCWAMVSLAVLAVTELGLAAVSGEAEPRWAVHVRFLAAATTFCPAMALLGAKRPQDRAWQFIVASLWMVAALPALQSLVYAPGRTLDLDTTWRWFLLLLIVISAANGLPTRFWPSWLLLAAAQGCLFASQLPLSVSAGGGGGVATALVLIVVATLLVTCGIPRRPEPQPPFDRQWCDFRDAFGTLWGLRIAERFNAAATMYGWPRRLRWRGLENSARDQDRPAADEFTDEQAASMRQVWHSLVLRFVSNEWLAERGDEPVAGTAPGTGGVH